MPLVHAGLARLEENVASVFLGKPRVIRLALTTLLARGHLLIEDAPGLGKTLLARALAKSLDAQFQRIQFTPDLLPSDITGVSIFDPREQRFEFRPGPVFTQILLADEINRGSPRTQSSLLETMEERQVTCDGETRPLPSPFLVIATQNPIEIGGTYPLPEAQLDRFLMRIELGYPESDEEARILELHRKGDLDAELRPVLGADDLRQAQEQVRRMPVATGIDDYIVSLARATREHPAIALGLSTRGAVALMCAAQAWSYLDGERFVSPDAVREIFRPVAIHRILLHAQREISGGARDEVIQEILDAVEVSGVPA
ncbi:MAG: MoxR family ATPase [Planctomycetes bacterium]|nr:MoxR family ATPase [Planctomycetota bacterium]